jgi:hypothetical protein
MGTARVTQAASVLVLEKRKNTACLYSMVVVYFGFNDREGDTRRVDYSWHFWVSSRLHAEQHWYLHMQSAHIIHAIPSNRFRQQVWHCRLTVTGHLFGSTEAGIAPADAVCKSECVCDLRSATLQLLQKNAWCMYANKTAYITRNMQKNVRCALITCAFWMVRTSSNSPVKRILSSKIPHGT